MSEKGFRVEIPVHIKRDRRARKVLGQGETPKDDESVPRMARLLALAHKWEGMVRRGDVNDYAEVARLNGLTKGRVAQVCCLALIAPDIQERLLNGGYICLQTVHLRQVGRQVVWQKQRETIRNRG